MSNHTDNVREGAVRKYREIAAIALLGLAGCGGGGGGGGGGGQSPPPAATPINLTFTASSSAVTKGQTVSVSWISSATDCTASGDWSGDKGAGGTAQITINQNSVLTLDCVNGGSNVSSSLRIEAIGSANQTTSTLAYSSIGGSTLSYVILPIDGVDQIYDPVNALIHVFTSANSVSYPQSLLSIDPVTAKVVASTPLTAAPWTMAVSADGQFLYLISTVSGAPIQRFKIPGLVADISIPVDSTANLEGIAVSPLSATTIAITAQVTVGAVAPSPQSLLEIIDGTTARPNSYLAPQQVTLLAPVWSADGSEIVVPGVGINVFSVTSQGVTLSSVTPSGGALNGRLYGDLFYDDGGTITSLHGPVALVGEMADYLESNARRAENIAINKSFTLDFDGFANSYLTAYSATQFYAIDSIQVPLSNGLSGPFGNNVLLWGTDGIAWDQGGSMVIAHGSFVQSGGSNAPPQALPTIGSGNLISLNSSSVSYAVYDARAYDLAVDGCGNFYASISGSAIFFGNTVVNFDPKTGAIKGFGYAASEPSVLAVAPDCSAIYAGSQDTNSIVRLSLPDLTPAPLIPLVQSPPPTGLSEGLPFAQSIAVSPSSASTIAVTMNFHGALCNSSDYGMAVFDGATRRPNVFSNPAFGPLTAVWSKDNSMLYEEDFDSGGGVKAFEVDASGPLQPTLLIPYASLEGDTDIYDLHTNVYFDPAKSRVLTNDGGVYDIASKAFSKLKVTPVINVNGCGLWGAITTAPSTGKIFYAEYDTSSAGIIVMSFDSGTLQKIDQVVVPVPVGLSLEGPFRLLRAPNSSTVAFVTTAGYVVSLDGNMFAP